MTPPSRINSRGSVSHGGESRERTGARHDRPWQDASIAIRPTRASLLRTTHACHRLALPAGLLRHKWQSDGVGSRGGGKPSCVLRGDEHITAQYQQHRHRSKAVGIAQQQRLAARSTTRRVTATRRGSRTGRLRGRAAKALGQRWWQHRTTRPDGQLWPARTGQSRPTTRGNVRARIRAQRH